MLSYIDDDDIDDADTNAVRNIDVVDDANVKVVTTNINADNNSNTISNIDAGNNSSTILSYIDDDDDDDDADTNAVSNIDGGDNTNTITNVDVDSNTDSNIGENFITDNNTWNNTIDVETDFSCDTNCTDDDDNAGNDRLSLLQE